MYLHTTACEVADGRNAAVSRVLKSMRRGSTVTKFAVYTTMPNTRLCDVTPLPFVERPEPAMLAIAPNKGLAGTCEQDGGFEGAHGPCH
jgi:hypothetical protein